MNELLEVFTARTPNGVKIPIMLEELGVDYTLHQLTLDPAVLRSPEYLHLNPNAKIPALRHRLVSGEEVRVFESGAILLYLADHFGALRGEAPQARADTLAWLFLQVSGLGPAMGNAGHFLSMRSPDPYATGRFQGEARRQLQLLEQRLSEVAWLNGETYSIADIAHFGWVRNAGYAGQDLAEFPALAEWAERISKREATMNALSRLA